MDIKWHQFTPLVVQPAATSKVVLKVKPDGHPTSVTVKLNAGPEKILRDDSVGADTVAGDGVYTVELSVAEVTHGFDAATYVNRNHVGKIRLYEGGRIVFMYNLFIDVLTPDIPTVDLRVITTDVQRTDHLANIAKPDFFSTYDRPDLVKAFYDHFGDDYDFLNVVYSKSHLQNRSHATLRADAARIGLGDPDPGLSGNYGSDGRLLGITYFPLLTYFDAGSRTHSHELGHQWIAYLPVPPLDEVIPHWPLSDLAAGVMGWAHGPYEQGLGFHFRLEETNGDYELIDREEPDEFTDLDLYLMGLMPPEEVEDHFVFQDQDQPVSSPLRGPVTHVSMSDILRQEGPRDPACGEARKRFRVATILVSEKLVSLQTMQLYDFFAARGSATQILSCSEGNSRRSSKPFFLATKRRGQLDMGINRRILVDSSRDSGVWWFPQTAPFAEADEHQGLKLAEHLRSIGHQVAELPRATGEPVITPELLAGYDLVIRIAGGAPYSDSEIDAYRRFVKRGGSLLLLAHGGGLDQLALSFGIRMEGTTRQSKGLDRFIPHLVVQGVESLQYSGSGVTEMPEDARIVGKMTESSFLDLDDNGIRDANEPSGPSVLGVMPLGFGRIVFCGDARLWLTVPQPLVENTLAWLGGADNTASKVTSSTHSTVPGIFPKL